MANMLAFPEGIPDVEEFCKALRVWGEDILPSWADDTEERVAVEEDGTPLLLPYTEDRSPTEIRRFLIEYTRKMYVNVFTEWLKVPGPEKTQDFPLRVHLVVAEGEEASLYGRLLNDEDPKNALLLRFFVPGEPELETKLKTKLKRDPAVKARCKGGRQSTPERRAMPPTPIKKTKEKAKVAAASAVKGPRGLGLRQAEKLTASDDDMAKAQPAKKRKAREAGVEDGGSKPKKVKVVTEPVPRQMI
ncbi:hypothetical protein B0H17DRAFT_1126526 [Mycena rosella]|uniref:Uncharacterized protein n=1 Tax=Mycena rosella TaxID=1033263 RepID=A0AAD7GTF3_MYCRO|nr:hypothetical protein B0H17DRAFT_1126526 [Mycena rosella]